MNNNEVKAILKSRGFVVSVRRGQLEVSLTNRKPSVQEVRQAVPEVSSKYIYNGGTHIIVDVES